MTSLTKRGLAREIDDIGTAIRAEPLVASHRLALAHLRLVQAEYPKALQQLQLACQLDAGLEPEAQLIRMLVRSEQVREAVFSGKVLPDLLVPASDWLESMIGAFRKSDEEAGAARRAALDSAPANKGCRGESSPFEWIADGDERLGPVIEVILGGVYYWIPFDMVESLEIPPPGRPVDLVWSPVDLKLRNYPARAAYMPSRYIMAAEERTDALLSCAETVWRESSGATWRGIGGRVWHVDGEPLGMFEAGRIRIEH